MASQKRGLATLLRDRKDPPALPDRGGKEDAEDDRKSIDSGPEHEGQQTGQTTSAPSAHSPERAMATNTDDEPAAGRAVTELSVSTSFL